MIVVLIHLPNEPSFHARNCLFAPSKVAADFGSTAQTVFDTSVLDHKARSRGQPRRFVRWRPPSGARRLPRRNRHPETRAPVCKPCVPRAHGATRPTPNPNPEPEPELLMCPITRAVFRDPVIAVDSGHTYERSAILAHFGRNGAKDPLTRRALSSTKVMTNWSMRNVVRDWLDKHPGVTPDGWDSRELLEPSKDDGTSDDEGVLRTWRAMCPELQEWWPEDEQPKDWEGVTIENGRVVELELEEFGLTGAVPAEIGRLSALRQLSLGVNQLTSVPAEIGQLTALEKLNLGGNQLTSLPAATGQLTSLKRLWLGRNQLTSVPAEIGQLTSLEVLWLNDNKLTTLPAAIGELRAAGCDVEMDAGVTFDE